MAAVDQGEHLLALKVMRLTRPTLIAPQIITCESQDLPKQCFREAMENEALTVSANEKIAAGQFMLLPQSFGNIYLGETFSSYICVHNCTALSVEGITVKADLQSNTSRVNLPMHEKKPKPASLGPDETLDDVIRYEVKEIGTHILVCEVNYLTPAGFQQYFRKFFKFQVLKPLDVQTKFFNVDMDETYLEAQIQNITNGPFCLEKVELEPSEHYTVTSLNTLPNGESVFSSKNMLQPKNSCQFLYCFKPKPGIFKNFKEMNEATNVGKLDIVWRSNLGEKGRLQTSQLHRLPFEYKDLRLEIIEAMNIVKVGEPFTFTCRLTNMTDQPMNLNVRIVAELDETYDFIPQCEYMLGSLNAGESREFPYCVCPVQLGLIKISPMILTNTLNQAEYTIEEVVDVFVIDTDYHEDETFMMNKFVRYYDNLNKREDTESVTMQVV